MVNSKCKVLGEAEDQEPLISIMNEVHIEVKSDKCGGTPYEKQQIVQRQLLPCGGEGMLE